MEGTKWYQSWRMILLAIFGAITLLLLALAGFYIANTAKKIKSGELPPSLVQDSFNGRKYEIKTADNYWIGSADPKVTIIEFSDFSCPFCYSSFSTIRELGIRYKDEIKIVYKDYPLRQEYSGDLSLAARCAGEQGLFWPMHDKLFLNQGISQKDEIADMAEQIGADMARFSKCVDENKYVTRIQDDIIEGNELGLGGTPTWFVNGYKIEGDLPMETWEQIIEKFVN